MENYGKKTMERKLWKHSSNYHREQEIIRNPVWKDYGKTLVVTTESKIITKPSISDHFPSRSLHCIALHTQQPNRSDLSEDLLQWIVEGDLSDDCEIFWRYSGESLGWYYGDSMELDWSTSNLLETAEISLGIKLWRDGAGGLCSCSARAILLLRVSALPLGITGVNHADIIAIILT